MIFGDIYTTGTASATNGSLTISLDGASALLNFKTGDMFSQSGFNVPIAEVVSNTELTLVYEWPGPTTEDAAYAVSAMSGQRHEPTETMGRVQDLLEDLEIFKFASPVIQVLMIGLNTPTGTELVGDVIVVGEAPTGAFAGHANTVARRREEDWFFHEPEVGWNVIAANTMHQWKWDGEAWTRVSGPLELSVFITDRPPANFEVFRHTFTTRTRYEPNFAGSTGSAKDSAEGSNAVFPVFKNGVQCGTVTYTIGNPNPIFATTDNLEVVYEEGDVMTIISPNPRNIALFNPNMVLHGST